MSFKTKVPGFLAGGILLTSFITYYLSNHYNYSCDLLWGEFVQIADVNGNNRVDPEEWPRVYRHLGINVDALVDYHGLGKGMNPRRDFLCSDISKFVDMIKINRLE